MIFFSFFFYINQQGQTVCFHITLLTPTEHHLLNKPIYIMMVSGGPISHLLALTITNSIYIKSGALSPKLFLSGHMI